MKKVSLLLQKIEERISSVLVPVMVLIVFVNTVGRYTTLFQFYWAEELARYLMIWSVFLGAAAAAAHGEHFAVDILVEKLPKKLRAGAYGLQVFLNLLFCGFVMYYGFRLVGLQVKLGQVSATLRFPMWIMYSAMPICALLMLMHYTLHGIEKIQDLRNEKLNGEGM